MVIADESYHEGVIGLAAGKLVEEFYRPAIVISKGEKISKASARSIYGFNIIEFIKKTNLILEGGGHPMAAGFSIETKNIKKFEKEINKLADKLLTDELLERKLKIDCELKFDQINSDLFKEIRAFEPFGQGNYSPLFYSKGVEIIESKKVGQEGKHLKLKLKQGEKIIEAIWFNAGELPTEKLVSVAFSIDENVWNGKTSLQLKVKDIKVN
jgi:single-stranded-DNA-specific exonuclease